jgi:SAM-dependent methyltransferase
MFTFVCNICGMNNFSETDLLDREQSSCSRCGSSVRFRSIVHLLTTELFGKSLILSEIPALKQIRGLGLTDWSGYAGQLAERFSYANTFYNCEPFFDITNPGPEHLGQYDFLIASEVFEHVEAPVEDAFAQALRVLKPQGFLILTVPFTGLTEETAEHFPNLGAYRIVELDGEFVLVNRRKDGSLETFDDLTFHGGPGSTLEMRLFAMRDLEKKLLASGFREVSILRESFPQFGVQLHQPWSLPLIARKETFAYPKSLVWQLAQSLAEKTRTIGELCREQAIDPSVAAETPHPTGLPPEAVVWQSRYMQVLEQYTMLRTQVAMASQSRWLALGHALGLGPKFDSLP